MIAIPLKVSEVLQEIERQEILLPEIQRSYVWKGPQVVKLLDSLYRGYPVGQILLWDTISLPITKGLSGTKNPSLPGSGRPKIVLDGQQRLTSLHLSLNDTTSNQIKIYFNVETEQFQQYLSRLNSDKRWIAVKDVVRGRKDDMQILSDLLDAKIISDFRDEKAKLYLNRIQNLKKIMDVAFPVEMFRSDSYEEVTELFVRINSGGTRLRLAELALAQLALRLPGVIVEKFEQAIDSYDDAGFSLDSRFLTRALIVAGTGQSRFRHLTDFWQIDPKEIERIWDKAKKSVDLSVNFVRNNTGFDSSDLLPSLNAMIPLTAYFLKHDRIANDVEKGLVRWFFLASLRGRYSGSGETNMDEDLKAIQSENPIENLIKNIESGGRSLLVTAEELDDAGERNPIFSLCYALAKQNRAKDWFTGVEVSSNALGSDNELQYHHIFPKALLKQHGVSRKDINEMANLAFLAARPNRQISAKEPHIYLAEIAKNHPERLIAQSVPLDPALWHIERYQDFLSERRILLTKGINKLIAE